MQHARQNARANVLNPNDRVLVSQSTVRAAGKLGISNAVLARVVGLSESQISRISDGRATLDGKAYELGLMLVRLFRGLSGIIGPDDAVLRQWLLGDNIALRARPIDHIQSVMGLTETVQYVDSRRAIL